MPPFFSRFLDFIYPAQCQLCQSGLSEGRHLCPSCIEQFIEVQAPFCQQCGECFDGKISDHFICPNCHDLSFSFEFARASYQNKGSIRDLIHEFKYLRQIHLAKELARLCTRGLTDPRFSPYIKNGILVPVPLYWKRQRNRHFNQSKEIARHLSALTHIPYLNALTRIRNTKTQTKFNRAKRLKNLKQAFKAKKKFLPRIQNQPIILLDDVFTTGSTSNECAKELIHSGAKSVAVLTVIRG